VRRSPMRTHGAAGTTRHALDVRTAPAAGPPPRREEVAGCRLWAHCRGLVMLSEIACLSTGLACACPGRRSAGGFAAGAVLLLETVRKTGLDQAISAAPGPWRMPRAVPDPGNVLLDVALRSRGAGLPGRCRHAAGTAGRVPARRPPAWSIPRRLGRDRPSGDPRRKGRSP
jgi:hypothetical protein